MNPHPSYQQQQPHSQHSHQQQGSYQSYPQQQQQQSSHSSQHGYSQRPVQQQQQQHSTSSHQPQQQQQQLQQQQQQQRYAQQQQGQHAPNYQQSSSSQSQSRPQSLYPPSSSSSSSMSGPPSSTSASRAFAAARLEHFLEYCDKEIRNFFAGGCDSDSPDFDRFMSFKSGVRDCLSAFRSNPTNIEAISSNPQYKQLISDLSKRFGEAYKPHMLQPPPQLQAAAQAQMQQQKQQQQQMSRPQQPPQMQQHQPQSQQHSQYSQQQQHPQHTQQDVHPPQQYTQSHQPPPTQQRNYPQSSTQQSNSQLQQQQRQQQHPSSSQHMPQQQQQQQQQQPQQPPPPQQQQQQPQQHPQSQMNANVAPSMQRVSSLDGSGRPVYNPNQSGAQAGARNLSALPPAQPPASLLSTSAAQAVTAMESRMNAGARGQSPQQPQQHLQQQQQQAPSSQQARQYPQQPPQQSQQQSQSQHAPQQAQHPPSQSTPGVNSGHAPDGPRVPPEIPEPIRPTPVTRLKRAAPDDLVRISTRVCRLMQMIDTPDTCALTVPALELPTYPPASSPLFILRNGAHPSHSEYLKHDVEIARAQGWTMVQQTNSFLLFRPSENRRYPLNLELNFTPTPTYPFEIPQWQFQSATVPPLLMQQVEQTVRTALGGQVMRLPQLLNKSFELARQIYDGIAKRAAASNAVGNNQIQP